MSVAAPLPETAAELFTARQRERRRALHDMMDAICRVLHRRDDVGTLRATFEDAVRDALPIRTAQLRDPSARWTGRPHGSPGAEAVALAVPGCDPGGGAGIFEATFDPSCPLGDWDFQLLEVAAQIGALVMEVERCRLQLARAGLLSIGQTRRDGAAPLIGSTPAMQMLRASIERVAVTDFTVLLEGESGVGKELVARQIHELSRRRSGPFVAINCAALVETLIEAELFGIEDRIATGVKARRGKFEAADGGTLFLDEVSDLSPSAQAKLLRAIQDLAVERVGGNGAHRVDIRIVAATNRRLADLVEARTFRPDLFYRLSGVDIQVPALRDRRADILELARYFLGRHGTTRRMVFSPEVVDALLAYSWPGNVRELERMIERAVALAASNVIGLEDLPPAVGGAHLTAFGPSLAGDDTLRAWARRYVRIVVARNGGNRKVAARALGISYHTLKAHLRRAAAEDPIAFAALGAGADGPGRPGGPGSPGDIDGLVDLAAAARDAQLQT